MAQVTTLSPNGVMGPVYTFAAKTPAADAAAVFVCMKNVTGTLMTADCTSNEMRAAVTGVTITAALTTRCE